MGGERRLCAHFSALAFKALQKRGLLAADIGACADPYLHVEGIFRSCDIHTKHPAFAGAPDGDLHRLDGMGIFGANIDVAVGGPGGDACDGHALDQHEGIAFHDHAVGEGA